jgi:hypothetical protein
LDRTIAIGPFDEPFRLEFTTSEVRCCPHVPIIFCATLADHYPGMALGDVAHSVGEPMLSSPKVLHMFRRHELVTELSQRTLSLRTPIYAGVRR